MLIRLGALALAIVAVFAGLLSGYLALVLLGLGFAGAAYWLAPVIWKRIGQ